MGEMHSREKEQNGSEMEGDVAARLWEYDHQEQYVSETWSG